MLPKQDVGLRRLKQVRRPGLQGIYIPESPPNSCLSTSFLFHPITSIPLILSNMTSERMIDGFNQGAEVEHIERNESGSTTQAQLGSHEETTLVPLRQNSSTSANMEIEHAEEVPEVRPHWSERRPFSSVKALCDRIFTIRNLYRVCKACEWYFLITGLYHLLIYFWLVYDESRNDLYWEKRVEQLAGMDEMDLWKEALTALGNDDMRWFSFVALHIHPEY